MTTPAMPDIAQIEITIVEMTNAFRQRHQLAPVQADQKLANAARAYAAYLARTGKFAHDADGRQPSERVTAAGYQFCYVAENLALQPADARLGVRELARETVEGWINSKGHREAMLAAHATETAVAIAPARDGPPRLVAVQLFARPRTLAYKFQVANSSGATVRYRFSDKLHELASGLSFSHTACLPGEIAFEGAAAQGSYAARDGTLFVLEKARGGYRVQMREKERID